MIPLMVACFMWILVAILSVRVRTRSDNTMFRAAVVIAASLTTNIGAIYLWSASWLPGPNVFDLVANVLLIVGVYYLSRAITRGATRLGAVDTARTRWTHGAALVTVFGMVISFVFIDNPEPSTTFMLSYGDQVPAATYSTVQYLYIFAVMALTLITCVHNVPRMKKIRFRLGFTIIGAGCTTALILCLSVLMMDAAHVLGADDIVLSVGPVYDYLYLLTVLLLCVGLGIPPLHRLLNSGKVRKQVLTSEPEVRRIWLATVAKAPTVSLVKSTSTMDPVKEHGTSTTIDGIHRMVIEIHDWASVGDGIRTCFSDNDRAVLREAERLCLQQGRLA